jgi:hypothetical protein
VQRLGSIPIAWVILGTSWRKPMQRLCFAAIVLAAAALVPIEAGAASAQIERGKYLVALGGCTDCHTPRPDGRELAPVMPWRGYSKLTKADATAIAAYLQSLPPVKHEIPGPFGPSDKVSVFVMDVLPADVYNSLPPAGPPPGK